MPLNFKTAYYYNNFLQLLCLLFFNTLQQFLLGRDYRFLVFFFSRFSILNHFPNSFLFSPSNIVLRWVSNLFFLYSQWVFQRCVIGRYKFFTSSSLTELNFLNSYVSLYNVHYLQKSVLIWSSAILLKGVEIVLFSNPAFFIRLFSFLRLNMLILAQSLMDILVLDFPQTLYRFQLIYYFLSYPFARRLLCIVSTTETGPLSSCFSQFKSANWIEREIWDLFGIYFLNHPDFRRLLTDYGFAGFPLRKDFPMTGFIELFFDDSTDRIVYVPLNFSQEFRVFQFSNSWEKNL